MAYRGRFAPSPTGPLHRGSLVAALASWLDARAHSGSWLVRIEDVDAPRCISDMGPHILGQLGALGLISDVIGFEKPLVQSQRTAIYRQALKQLIAARLAYPCHCSRSDILIALEARGQRRARKAELVYPGTCAGWDPATEPMRTLDGAAWRLRCNPAQSMAPNLIDWHDRRLGAQQQNVASAVGDFVLLRADGFATYQLAVVVDDAAQGITHIVRGEDLTDNTARQISLQRSLGFGTPYYLHTPLVRGEDGEKLSKQNGARALDTSNPMATLNQAAAVLGLRQSDDIQVSAALAAWVQQWRLLYNCKL